MGMNSVNVCGIQHPKYRLVGTSTGLNRGALEADHQLSTDPGATLIILKGYSTTAGFVLLMNAAAAPADATAADVWQAVAANDNFSFIIPTCGLPQTLFTNGMYVCFSSTGPTKTIGGAVCNFEAYLI